MTSRVRVCALVVVLVACVGALGACANDEAGGRMRAFDDTGFPPDAIEEGWMVALPASDATWDLLGAYPEGGHRADRNDPRGRRPRVRRCVATARRPAGGSTCPLLPVSGRPATCRSPTTSGRTELRAAACCNWRKGHASKQAGGENGFWAVVD